MNWLCSVLNNQTQFLFILKFTVMEITARVTADAKVNTLKDERQVVNFNVAINDSYKPKDGREIKKMATFIQCAYWINPAI